MVWRSLASRQNPALGFRVAEEGGIKVFCLSTFFRLAIKRSRIHTQFVQGPNEKTHTLRV